MILNLCLKSNDYISWVCLWIPYVDIPGDPHGSITVLTAKANQGKYFNFVLLLKDYFDSLSPEFQYKFYLPVDKYLQKVFWNYNRDWMAIHNNLEIIYSLVMLSF